MSNPNPPRHIRALSLFPREAVDKRTSAIYSVIDDARLEAGKCVLPYSVRTAIKDHILDRMIASWQFAEAGE
jgi:hypothetical protein